jgi:hypothetical protein
MRFVLGLAVSVCLLLLDIPMGQAQDESVKVSSLAEVAAEADALISAPSIFEQMLSVKRWCADIYGNVPEPMRSCMISGCLSMAFGCDQRNRKPDIQIDGICIAIRMELSRNCSGI